MLDIETDKTNTESFEMADKCPFGGDRIGGTLGTPPTLSDWYPNRLKVEQLHSNGPQADPLDDDFTKIGSEKIAAISRFVNSWTIGLRPVSATLRRNGLFVSSGMAPSSCPFAHNAARFSKCRS